MPRRNRSDGAPGWVAFSRLFLQSALIVAFTGSMIAAAEPRQKLVGHRGPASFLEFSPNGEHLVSSDVNSILLWDLKTGKSENFFSTMQSIVEEEVRPPRPGFPPVWPEMWMPTGLAFADDGQGVQFYFGGMPAKDGEFPIELWDVTDMMQTSQE
jgi:WD40 repeat protein